MRVAPGLFSIVNTSRDNVDRSLDEIIADIESIIEESRNKYARLLGKKVNVLNGLIKTKDSKAILLLTGGVRGGIEPTVERKIRENLDDHFEVKTGVQIMLTPDDVVRRYSGILAPLAEDLKKDGFEEDMVKTGLRLIEQENGWQFKLWVGSLGSKPRAKRLWLIFTYLGRNIRLLHLTAKEKLEERMALLSFYGISEERMQEILKEFSADNIANLTQQDLVKSVVAGADDVLRAHENSLHKIVSDELAQNKALQLTLQDIVNLGLSLETVSKFINGVYAPKFHEILGLVNNMKEGELDLAIKERETIRDEVVSKGWKESRDELYKQIKSAGEGVTIDAGAQAYQELKVLFEKLNPAVTLENLVRNGRLFKVIPELAELSAVASLGRHDGFNMLEHTINAVRRTYFIEEARLCLGINNEVVEQERFKDIFARYKQDVPGLSGLRISTFKDLVATYKDVVMSLKLRTPGRENDGRILFYLSILLHDIGKSIVVSRHLPTGKKMAGRIFARLGFNESDARIAALLINNHSVYTRLLTGEDTYSGVINQIESIDNDISFKEIAFKAFALMCVADIGGIGYTPALSDSKIKDILAKVADIVFILRIENKDKDEKIKKRLTRLFGFQGDVEYVLRKEKKEKEEKGTEGKLLGLLEKVDAISKNNSSFKEFIVNVPLDDFQPYARSLEAQTLANLLYLAYKYWEKDKQPKAVSISLSDEKPITEADIKVLNSHLSDKTLWEGKDLNLEKLQYLGISIYPDGGTTDEKEDKVIVIKLETTREPRYVKRDTDISDKIKNSLRDARHKFASQSEGRYKTQADIQRRYRDIFNKTGINYNQGNIFINVISMKRETLTALFIDNFKEAIRSNNDLLEGEITIDIDKKYIRFKSRSSKMKNILYP